MNYYLFTTVDASHFELSSKVPAIEIINHRLSINQWPIYSGTRNKAKLTKGDECLFYVGGYQSNRQHIIASATIEEVVNDNALVDHEDILTSIPEKKLKLTNIDIFKRPINIKKLLDELSFVPENKRCWGTSLQGGCKQLSRIDFNLMTPD
jgi:hypothetical protein